jgi:hypothetical protein
MAAQSLVELESLASKGDSQAMYQLGLLFLRQDNVQSAFNWLYKAHNLKHIRSTELLGVLVLQGHGVKPNPKLALEYFRSAAMYGDAQALMRCAEMMFSGKGVLQERSGAIGCVIESAKQGYPVALRTVGFFLLRQVGVPIDIALRAFRLAAYGGDPHSQFVMAKQASTAAEKNSWMRLASQRGLYLAQHVNPGEPNTFDLSAVKGDLNSELQTLIPYINVLRQLDKVVLPSSIVSEKAGISVFENALSGIETDYIINISASMLSPAKVVSANNTIKLEDVRTGMTASLGHVLDLTVDWLVERISGLIGQSVKHAEVPSVIRYNPGQMYKQHGDYLPEGSDLADRVKGGQRSHTALVYLNDGYNGGATRFNLLDVVVQPKQGQLLTFSNITPQGQPLLESQHTGEVVLNGEKWLLSIWFRQFATENV